MVNVVFKQTDSIFGHSLQPNVLTIYIQPNEGFSLSINGKEVGENSVSHQFPLITKQMRPQLGLHQSLMKN